MAQELRRVGKRRGVGWVFEVFVNAYVRDVLPVAIDRLLSLLEAEDESKMRLGCPAMIRVCWVDDSATGDLYLRIDKKMVYLGRGQMHAAHVDAIAKELGMRLVHGVSAVEDRWFRR
jgi:RNA binding exosome subunit